MSYDCKVIKTFVIGTQEEKQSIQKTLLGIDNLQFEINWQKPVILDQMSPVNFSKVQPSISELSTGKGNIGCNLAHFNVWSKIANQSMNSENRESMFYLVLEGDALLTDYGKTFFERIFFNDLALAHLVQLGGIKPTSGRVGQKVSLKGSFRNYFLSDLLHSMKEDYFEVFRLEPKFIRGWLGGTHAYLIDSVAAIALTNNPPGTLCAVDDYFKAVALSTNWVFRLRQNAFVQSDSDSLIDQFGR